MICGNAFASWGRRLNEWKYPANFYAMTMCMHPYGQAKGQINGGFGFEYGDEDSDMWFGSRSYTSVCYGIFDHPNKEPATEIQPQEYLKGEFIEANYLPLGFSVFRFPFTPGNGNVMLPQVNFGMGLHSMIQNHHKVTYNSQSSKWQKTSSNKLGLLLGPAASVGGTFNIGCFFMSASYFASLNYTTENEKQWRPMFGMNASMGLQFNKSKK